MDGLIEEVAGAKTRADLVAAARALDRALTFGRYVVPHWYLPVSRIAVNAARLAWPERTPLKGVDLMSWWAR